MNTEFSERYIALGLKIAYYRKKAGYTQEVLAELIDKSVNFLGQVEGPGTVCGISRPPSCWRMTNCRNKNTVVCVTTQVAVFLSICVFGFGQPICYGGTVTGKKLW